jgi:phosphomannomutase
VISCTLSCFKAYDIRGRLGAELNAEIAYRIGRSTAEILKANNIVIGYDARATSTELATAVANGVREAGASVLDIGLVGTEEMYWAVTSQGASAGIEVTASHNPIDYNGMKIVKQGSQPLTESEFQSIRRLAEAQTFKSSSVSGEVIDCSLEARRAYLEKIVDFVVTSRLKPLKIVINSGNGAAGPTFDALADKLFENGVEGEFVRVQHTPDATFPNGIPNPLLPQNHAATSDVVKATNADFWRRL